MSSLNSKIQITIAGLSEDRKELSLPHNGWTLSEIAAEFLPAHGGYAVSVDGEIIQQEQWNSAQPRPGSQVLFVPDFGDIVGAIWALMTIMAGTYGTAAAASFWATTAALAVKAAIIIGGVYLAKALMPGPPGEGPSPSQAYSWDPATTQQQGLPIPKAYGKLRLHGNIIATHVLPSSDSKHLNIYALIAFCEGPVKSISDIRLQNQAYGNFSDVTVETRRGLLSQTYVSFFDKTRRCYKVNRTIKQAEGAFNWQTPGKDFDDVEIIMRCQMYYYHKDGSAEIQSCSFKIEAKKTTDGTYTTVFDGSVNNSGHGSNVFWKKYKLSDAMTMENGARYDVKITKISTPDGPWDGGRKLRDICFEFANEVLNDGFMYPGIVLAGISALRTEELTPPLDVSAEIEGAIVDAYDGSTWALGYSNSPAWVNYDVLTQPVISGDTGTYQVEEYEGLDWQKIVDADWWELSQFCDVLCPDGKGGTEKRITFNGIFDRLQSLWDAVLASAEMARCTPYWRGNRLRLAINKPKNRVGILSVGNILQGSFEESFSGKTDLASEVEITYNDSDSDFERVTLPIYSSSLTTYKNKVSLTPLGIARQSEAWRYAKFRLAHNELLKRSMKAQGDIDCIGYHLGDRIGVQHDVPNWNALKEMGCRGGGRLVGYEPGTNDKLILDCDIEDSLEAGQTYEIAVRLQDADAPVIKTILSASGNQVVISGQFTGTKPQANDLWAIGKQNLVLKDFIIIDRKQTEEQQFTVELIEYNANLWAADEAAPVVPDVTAIAPRAERPLVRQVRPVEIQRREPNVTVEFPTVDILIPSNLKWNNEGGGYVSWSADDGATPILVSYKGIGYEITAGNSNLKYIYWDLANPNILSATNTRSETVGPNKRLLCQNIGGTAYPVSTGTLVPGEIIVDGTILSAALADNAVTTAKLADLNVTTAKLAELNVTLAKLASDSVDTTKLVADAVTSVKIAAGAIIEAKLADNAVTAGKINALAVTTGKLDALAVTTEKLAATAVTTAKIAAGAVTATEIATGAITAIKIAAGAVEADKIVANAVTADKIAANAVTAGKILAGEIGTDHLAANAVTASKIAADQIQTGHLIANAVTTAKINDLNVTTPKIADNAATDKGSNFTSGSISVGQSEVTIQSLSFTVVSNILLQFSCAAYATGGLGNPTYRVYRDSTLIYSATTGPPISGGILVSFNISDSPSAGTYTYSIRSINSSTLDTSISNRSLYIQELKK